MYPRISSRTEDRRLSEPPGHRLRLESVIDSWIANKQIEILDAISHLSIRMVGILIASQCLENP